MADRYDRLFPADSYTLSPGPYAALGDGTILDADGRTFCVMGAPEDELAEQDIANGAAVLALPELIDLARLVAARALTQSKASADRAREILRKAGVKP
jgi:hypothetical protein